MIRLLDPAALALLVALPTIWWLHRRGRRAASVVLPSLLFFEPEPATSAARARRRVDSELVLALAAALLLALAAAGPVRASGDAGRRITIVRDVSASMSARASDGSTAFDRSAAAIRAISARLGPDGRVDVVECAGDACGARLRDAGGGVRVLVSDRRPPDLPSGATFVGVGDPGAVNAGLVAVDVAIVGGRRIVSATIWNDAGSPRTLEAGPVGAMTTVRLPAFGAVRASWDATPPSAGGAPASLTIRLLDEGGTLASDDQLTLEPSPIRVAFDPVPAAADPAVVEATRAAFEAVCAGAVETGGDVEGGVFVGPIARAPRGVRVVLEIARVPAGVEPVRPSARAAFAAVDGELATDLDPSSAEWLYPPGASAASPFPRISVDRARSPGVVLVRWHADPSLGRPRAIDLPLWPLFIGNVVRFLGARPGPAGHRVEGLLDVSATRVGRDVLAFDPGALDAAPRAVVARSLLLAPVCAAAGAICLALLWFLPRTTARAPVR